MAHTLFVESSICDICAGGWDTGVVNGTPGAEGRSDRSLKKEKR